MDFTIVMMISGMSLGLAIVSKAYCKLTGKRVEEYIKYNKKQDNIREAVRRKLIIAATVNKPAPSAPSTPIIATDKVTSSPKTENRPSVPSSIRSRNAWALRELASFDKHTLEVIRDVSARDTWQKYLVNGKDVPSINMQLDGKSYTHLQWISLLHYCNDQRVATAVAKEEKPIEPKPMVSMEDDFYTERQE